MLSSFAFGKEKYMLLFIIFIYTVSSQTVVPPNDLINDDKFNQCLGNRKCGLENICHYIMKSEMSDYTDYSDIPSYKKEIAGHIFSIKNDMPYNITFYWNAIGKTSRSNDTNFHEITIIEKSYGYVDTGLLESHVIRLFLKKPEVKNKKKLEFSDLDLIQRLEASDTKCTQYQACLLLYQVCYLNTDNDNTCVNYMYHCEELNKNKFVKNSCIPECLQTYWADKFPEFKELDSEEIVNWILKGGGTKEGKFNGSAASGVIIFLAISNCLCIMFMFFIYISFKKRYNENLDFDINGEFD